VAGDAGLTSVAQVAFNGATSFDASTLSFSFNITDPNAKSITFSVVFGSEEYPEFARSQYVDVAAVFVNGTNVALFDGDPSLPLSVTQKNIDGGYFRDNGTRAFGIQYDGLSVVLTVVAPVVQGQNTIKIGVADTGDRVLDSGLFVSGLKTLSVDAGGIFQTVIGGDGADSFDHSSSKKSFFYDLGNGADFVKFSTGKNVALFGAGDDTGVSAGGASENKADGGDGIDTWLYPTNFDPGLIKVLDGGVIKVGANSDFLTNFEFIQFNDKLVRIATDQAQLNSTAGDDIVYLPNLGVHDNRWDSSLTFHSGSGDDVVFGGTRNDKVAGDAGNDILDGGAGDDDLSGGSGNDILFGGVGNDRLVGGAGNDALIGGLGADRMTGSEGRDIFVFNAIDKDLAGKPIADAITDFKQGEDRIDLSSLYQGKIFGGLEEVKGSGIAGAVEGLAGFKAIFFTQQGKTFFAADVDGQTGADILIELNGAMKLSLATDFLIKAADPTSMDWMGTGQSYATIHLDHFMF
jgi:Ca2+-binding RTX toxin-like protein